LVVWMELNALRDAHGTPLLVVEPAA
jgi:hypothetical protein